ncbi:ribosomal RNA adenine methyltransferase KsgA/Erm [Dichotomocladium elegans]|nr:ribosomal RNA adenine methyltransferase KsgA/Erm [Dichotomocladium elegans]
MPALHKLGPALKLPKLPTFAEWSTQFKSKGAIQLPRATIASNFHGSINVESALSKIKIDNLQDMTVVDIYPGLGVWAAGLVNAGCNRVLAVENNPKYAKWMASVADCSNGVIELVKKDGYDWETYVDLKKPEYLGSLIDNDWSRVHPHILFTGTIPKTVKGDQLIAQFATYINNKMAMHSNGRIQMLMWMQEALYSKITAPPGSSARCKMSVVLESCAKVEKVHTTDIMDVYPRTEYCLANITPLEKSKIKADWDVFVYVLKHLMVMQRKPLSKMIK